MNLNFFLLLSEVFLFCFCETVLVLVLKRNSKMFPVFNLLRLNAHSSLQLLPRRCLSFCKRTAQPPQWRVLSRRRPASWLRVRTRSDRKWLQPFTAEVAASVGPSLRSHLQAALVANLPALISSTARRRRCVLGATPLVSRRHRRTCWLLSEEAAPLQPGEVGSSPFDAARSRIPVL